MFLVSRLISLPLYRRYRVRKAAAWFMPDRLYAALAFRKDHGRFPAFPPATYNERVSDLIGSGRLRDYALYGDKLALRDYAAARVGKQYLVPLHATADRLTPALWERLPDSFMLKANHGSHWSRLVRNKQDEDFDALVALTDGWLAKDYYYFYRERQYHRIRPRLMMEQVLEQGAVQAEGGGIIDYKVYCFHGRPLFLHAVRGQPARHRSLYDFTWTKLDVRYRLPNDPDYPRPDKLDEMYRVAAALSQGLDFARVDLYCVPDGVFFGEVTLAPLAGSDPFDPPDFDAFLGALWADPAAAWTATLEQWHADAMHETAAV